MFVRTNFEGWIIIKLISVIDALPVEWRESLNTFASTTADEPFNLHNEIKLSFRESSFNSTRGVDEDIETGRLKF